jgi:N-acylneuraminate cytidylyltransferase
MRPAEIATSTSPDIEWIRHLMGHLQAEGRVYEVFSLLRATSPFRQAATIRRAMDELLAHPEADSIRAVELCRQHPGKMWVLDGEYMKPLMESPAGEVPYHSRQYQSLPPVYAQNSSLEIARTRIIDAGEIAGSRVLPFVCEGPEGFSIDYPAEWEAAERMAASGEAQLPAIARQPLTPAPGV